MTGPTAGPIIASVATRRLSVPLHTPFVTALRRATTVETVLVCLRDSDGVEGWGEAPQVWQVTGDSVAGAEACLQGPLRTALIGTPADPAVAAPVVARAVVANHAAKMAADVALHDLAARRAGVPLAVHLGAASRQARRTGPVTAVYTDVTLAAGTSEELATAARARVADGFTALKLKVGTDAATDVERVRAVRDAVGPDVEIRLDANQGWNAHSAVDVVRALEDADLGVSLVEQPVPAHDVLGLAFVRARVATPVMADESVFTLLDLVEVIRAEAADLVNVKLAKCGGLTPAIELVRVARAHGIGVGIGSMMETHVGIGAAGALAAAVEPEVVSDLDAAWWTATSPYAGGPSYDGDRLLLGAGPGLGLSPLPVTVLPVTVAPTEGHPDAR